MTGRRLRCSAPGLWDNLSRSTAGLGSSPTSIFAGPAPCKNFGVWPHPNCLPFSGTPEKPPILNASRLQTQGNNEPCSNFSLRTLLTELCEPYRLIAEAKGIKFKIELSSDAFVYLPEGRLKKAISNILSNAVNYTEAGQSISVVFDKNKLSVSNECSVLPPEQLQHIFEPFYRPDLAHSQATGGNGLGLYIVQTILDKLRLKYQFVPMPNDRGMSFTIQF